MHFEIRPGRYTIPEFGKLDTRQEISDERSMELYENRHFPWISPKDTKEALEFLKKQKLTVKRISALILKAQSEKEIKMLLELNDSKALKNIASTRRDALES